MSQSENQSTGISAKDAALAAATYYTSVTGNTSGVTIEEIEKSEDDKYWLVTLGIPEQNPLGGFYVGGVKKNYKKFQVDCKTGDVVSMKIREI